MHEYRDDDIEGVLPVIRKIDKIRQEWRQVIKTTQYFEKTGQMPTEVSNKSVFDPKVTVDGVADLQVELNRLNVNISKYSKKISLSPGHKKHEQWVEDLAKMEAIKNELRQNIINLTYASKQ